MAILCYHLYMYVETPVEILDSAVEQIDPTLIDKQHQQRNTSVRRAVIAAAIVGSAVASLGHSPYHTETQVNANPVIAPSCTAQSAEDYAAADMLLNDPGLAVSSNPRILLQTDREPLILTDEGWARFFGATVLSESYWTSMRDLNERMNFYLDAPEKVTPEVDRDFRLEYFERTRSFVRQSYGIDVTLQAQPETIRNNNTKELADTMPASEEDLSWQDLQDLSNAITNTPREFFEIAGVNNVVLYTLGPAEKDKRILGYVNGPGKIHLALGAIPALRHELGHQIDRAERIAHCDSDVITADSNITALNSKTTGTLTPNIDNLEGFLDAYQQEILSAELTVAEQTIHSQQVAQCSVARAHPRLTENIKYQSNYHTNDAEDKAEILETIFKDQGEMNPVTPCFPRLYAKYREMIARLHSLAPGATRYIMFRHYIGHNMAWKRSYLHAGRGNLPQ